jgi:hypothetical protein
MSNFNRDRYNNKEGRRRSELKEQRDQIIHSLEMISEEELDSVEPDLIIKVLENVDPDGFNSKQVAALEVLSDSQNLELEVDDGGIINISELARDLLERVSDKEHEDVSKIQQLKSLLDKRASKRAIQFATALGITIAPSVAPAPTLPTSLVEDREETCEKGQFYSEVKDRCIYLMGLDRKKVKEYEEMVKGDGKR